MTCCLGIRRLGTGIALTVAWPLLARRRLRRLAVGCLRPELWLAVLPCAVLCCVVLCCVVLGRTVLGPGMLAVPPVRLTARSVGEGRLVAVLRWPVERLLAVRHRTELGRAELRLTVRCWTELSLPVWDLAGWGLAVGGLGVGRLSVRCWAELRLTVRRLTKLGLTVLWLAKLRLAELSIGILRLARLCLIKLWLPVLLAVRGGAAWEGAACERATGVGRFGRVRGAARVGRRGWRVWRARISTARVDAVWLRDAPLRGEAEWSVAPLGVLLVRVLPVDVLVS